MREIKIIRGASRIKIDDMVWPYPDKHMGEIEWKLRYGELSKAEMLNAAGIIEAYKALVQIIPDSLRNEICKIIQKETKKTATRSSDET